MGQLKRTGLAITTALLLIAPSVVGNAQQRPLKEQVIGTWTLVSGSQIGPNARGMLILDPSGHMSMQIIRPGQAKKFAANNRTQGTPGREQIRLPCKA